MKLAVLFPGVGYTADRSLLHYGRRIAEQYGYESVILNYHGFPKKIRGDREKLRKACGIACRQAEALLADRDLSACEELLFIAKSIGTVAAAQLAGKSPAGARVRFVLYTPLEETFAHPLGDAVVFTGSGDPWVGGEDNRIPALCRQRGIACYLIPGANHSLESGDPLQDLRTLQEVMGRTADFIGGRQRERIAHYEALLCALREAEAKPALAAAELPALRAAAEELARYYAGAEWKRDFADDEAGLLPRDLKRGVLSEDGIDSALDAFRERFGNP